MVPSRRAHSCILGLGLLSSAVLRAQTGYESFDYGTGVLTGSTGGTGFSGAWVNYTGSDYSIVSGSLSANSLTTAGNSASGTGETYRTLSSALGGSGQQVWFSAVVNITAATGGGNDFAGVYFGGSGGAYFMGASNNGSKIGIVSAGNASLSNGLDLSTAVSYSLGTSYLLVLHFDFTSATGGNYFFYFNPTSGTDPGTPTHGSGSGLAFAMSNTNLVGVYSGGMTLNVDEIRLGSTYASVVPGVTAIPEPAAWTAIAGAGVLGVAWWRSRRRSGAGNDGIPPASGGRASIIRVASASRLIT